MMRMILKFLGAMLIIASILFPFFPSLSASAASESFIPNGNGDLSVRHRGEKRGGKK